MTPEQGAAGQKYRASGKIGLAFLPLSMGVLVIATGLAYGLSFAFDHGFYYMIIMPLLAAMMVAGIMLLAVSWGHCRSPLIAMVVGLSAGLVLYLGRYHVDMIARLGTDMAWKVHLLPRYIAVHMAAQEVGHDADNVKGVRPGIPQGVPQNKKVFVIDRHVILVEKSDREGLNWGFFALELGVVVFFTAGAARVRARKPYCETFGHWMKQDLAFLPSGNAKAVAEAFRSDTLTTLTELPSVNIGPNSRYTAMAVEYCPKVEDQVRECPVYFSVKEVWKGGGAGQFNQFDAVPGRMLLRRVALSNEQAAALAPKFPALQSRVEQPVPTLELAPEAQPANAIALAEIRALEPPYFRQIMTKQTLVICNLLILVPALVLLSGMAMTLTAAYWWSEAADQAQISNQSPRITLYVAMICMGVVLGATGGYLQFRNGTYIANRYLRNLTRKIIRARPNSLVDVDDPEAIFVEIVPRRNWGRMMGETASDVGFFLIDPVRGELRFEGDCETYRVPGSAITYCEIEEVIFGEGIPGSSITIYPTVVGADTATGPWEAPIVFRGDFGSLGAGKRRQRAEEMCDKIQAIIPGF